MGYRPNPQNPRPSTTLSRVEPIYHTPGEHELTMAEHGTRYVAAAARVLVDPADADDVADVAAIQDGLGLRAGSAQPFEAPTYDTASLDATRNALLELARGVDGFTGAFGAPDEVRSRIASDV